MEENKPIEPSAEEPKPKKRFNPFQFLSGEFLQKEDVLRHMPFLIFMAFIAAIYIGNKYYGENLVRKINLLNQQLKETHSEYIAGKALLTERCKQTEVEQNLTEQGIKVSIVPPRVIQLSEKQKNKIY